MYFVGLLLASAITLLIMITMTSCAPNVVYVPTPVPCVRPTLPERPVWPISAFKGTETYGEIIQGFGASLSAEKGYSDSLRILIEGIK
jgi:hypothetical protein